MKLIIDIPEEAYNVLLTEQVLPHIDVEWLLIHGTPLDDVKTEIETDLSFDMFDEYGNETRLHKDLMNILDNIGKAERGDNE